MLGLRTAKKLVIGVIGATVALLGVVMLVTPGPGVPAIILGLAILATEFVWAELLLRKVKKRARSAADKVMGRKKNGAGDR